MTNLSKKGGQDRIPRKIMRAWQLQTAKARLSEVVRLARSEGPQLITRQGQGEVVVMTVELFEQLLKKPKQSTSLVQFFAESPLATYELDLSRDRDAGRKIEL